MYISRNIFRRIIFHESFFRKYKHFDIFKENEIVTYEPGPNYPPKIRTIMHFLRNVKKWSLDDIRGFHRLIECGKIDADYFERLPLRCHGCGSFYHSDPQYNHGYLKEELFHRIQSGVSNLSQLRCKSCYDQIYHSKMLPVFMDPKKYNDMMSFIKSRPCLVIYMLDVTDMYGSVPEGLADLLNYEKRIIVVFNKLDLLPQDGNHLLAIKHLEKCSQIFLQSHPFFTCFKVVDSVLTSLKFRHGLNALIKSITKNYMPGQNLVIMGGCNAGKSTLFNIIQNLISYQNLQEFPSPATISACPGTTTNLIRIPITSNLIKLMKKNIGQEHAEIEPHENYTVDQRIFEDLKHEKYIVENLRDATIERANNVNKIPQYHLSNASYSPTCQIREQRWLYDTPSIPSKYQLWPSLTTGEIKHLNISCIINPRSFKIPEKYSICIGNLCRIDVLSVTKINLLTNPSPEHYSTNIILSLFIHRDIPAFTCPTHMMSARMENLGRQGKLLVPANVSDQITNYNHTDVSIHGVNIKRCASDICISSLGWIGVSPPLDFTANLRIWTRGQKINLRTPSLIPQLIMWRGRPGVHEFGRYSSHSYKFMKNIQSVTKFFVDSKDCRQSTDVLNHIQEKRKMSQLESKKEHKLLLKLDSEKLHLQKPLTPSLEAPKLEKK